MSSKLVKKLLQRTTDGAVAPPPSKTNVGGSDRSNPYRRDNDRRTSAAANGAPPPPSSSSSSSGGGGRTKRTPREEDDVVRDRVESLLRLDDAVSRYSSSTVRKSFDRRTDVMKRDRRRRRDAANVAAGTTGNSRGSASAFALRPAERRFDRVEEKRRREESYFKDLARALKRGKKRKGEEKKSK
jgi:hypothetical protein